MEFTGNNGNKKYTITITASEVESVLVECLNSCDRWYYQREPKMNALVINKAIFEETVRAICRDDSKEWEKLYCELKFDLCYAKMMQSAYKKFIWGFMQTQLHKDSFWS